MVERMLRVLGHDVTTAADTASGRQHLETDLPDLLVTDLLIPGEVGGLEFARQARAQRPGLPVLVISGFALVSITARAVPVSDGNPPRSPRR